VLEVGSGTKFQLLPHFHIVRPPSGSIKELGGALDSAIVARFLEEEIICKFGVPRFILIDNGGEWMLEFDLMCKKMGLLINSQLHNGLNAMG